MRGTRLRRQARALHDRIIPAHAGNSAARSGPGRTCPDHPRACGELLSRVMSSMSRCGSSPRMRGTRLAGACEGFVNRIIPAHAGNSRSDPTACTSTPDHPRACGELPDTGEPEPSPSGSSPRMRGTQLPPLRFRVGVRIIPAHAGNSRGADAWGQYISDHPRACGELIRLNNLRRPLAGSSPRMRGTHQLLDPH